MTAYEMRISDWSADVCSSGLFRMCERRYFRDVFVDLFGRALAFAGDHFFDDFGMKREVDVDEVKRCGQLGDDAFHGLLGRVCGSDISGVVFRQPDDLCRSTVQLDGEFNRLARREQVTNASVLERKDVGEGKRGF